MKIAHKPFLGSLLLALPIRAVGVRGLAVRKRTVERHGGGIRAEARPGQGGRLLLPVANKGAKQP
jgi:hypothetical protein